MTRRIVYWRLPDERVEPPAFVPDEQVQPQTWLRPAAAALAASMVLSGPPAWSWHQDEIPTPPPALEEAVRVVQPPRRLRVVQLPAIDEQWAAPAAAVLSEEFWLPGQPRPRQAPAPPFLLDEVWPQPPAPIFDEEFWVPRQTRDLRWVPAPWRDDPLPIAAGVLVFPPPAAAAISTVNPLVILGSIVVVPPTPASAAIATINPLVLAGSLIITPPPASARIMTVGPGAILSGTGQWTKGARPTTLYTKATLAPAWTKVPMPARTFTKRRPPSQQGVIIGAGGTLVASARIAAVGPVLTAGPSVLRWASRSVVGFPSNMRTMNEPAGWVPPAASFDRFTWWVDVDSTLWSVNGSTRILQRSVDNGDTFVPVGNAMPNLGWATFAWMMRLRSGRIIVGGLNQASSPYILSCCYTDDLGQTWTSRTIYSNAVSFPYSPAQIWESPITANLLATCHAVGSADGGVWISSNGGDSWTRVATSTAAPFNYPGSGGLKFFYCVFFTAGGALLLHVPGHGESSTHIWRATAPTFTDWSLRLNSTDTSGDLNDRVHRQKFARVFGGSRLIFRGRYKSDDDGVTWTLLSNPLITGSGAGMGNTNHAIYCQIDDGTALIKKSTDGGETWTDSNFNAGLRGIWGGYELQTL